MLKLEGEKDCPHCKRAILSSFRNCLFVKMCHCKVFFVILFILTQFSLGEVMQLLAVRFQPPLNNTVVQLLAVKLLPPLYNTVVQLLAVKLLPPPL